MSEGDQELRSKVDTLIRDVAVEEKARFFLTDYEKILPPHYRLIEMIGRGGMAEVFRARDERLHRDVAIKFLNSAFRNDPGRMSRFTREARAASALNHPNILIIHDIGETNGVQFIVSEFVDGETLSSRLARGRIPLAVAIDIAIQIASALSASHKAGIVHRDIKPDNIMVRRDGTVKVLDFGLAKDAVNSVPDVHSFDSNSPTRNLASTGLILGTPQYMSPEQARGRRLDARTDIFSLGIIIFEMVTGQQPFPGNTAADVVAAIIGKEPRKLEEYLDNPPVALIQIVEKALRKNREQRYATIDQLLTDLKGIRPELDGKHIGAVETARIRTRTFHDAIDTIIGKSLHWEPLVLFAAVAILALAGWWYLKGATDGELKTTGSIPTMPITNWRSDASELVFSASFSPDAKMIAYAATKTQATEIWVKPVIGGSDIQVTKNGFYNQYPIWSPSGQEIAFFSSLGKNRGIWRTSFTGGERTLITSDVGPTARPMYWSKSGKIYFQEDSELFTVDETSGDRLQITDFKSEGLKPRTIEISPDESTVAYSVKEKEDWKVRVERLDTGDAEEIATPKEQVDYMSWNPAGKAVLFSTLIDGANQIFQANIQPSDPIRLTSGDLNYYVQDVSNDGSKILYGSASETSDLWTVNTENSMQSPLVNDVAAEYWADFSPDGKSIVFQTATRVDNPLGGSITVMPFGVRPAMVVSAQGSSPVWSRTGRWIAFFRRTGDGIGIFRVTPTGDDTVKLADGAVAFPSYTATPYLKIGVNNLDWSPPDDQLVAYSAKAAGISNIWLAASDGSGSSVVTQNSDPDEFFCCPMWTSSGKYLVYLSQHSSKSSPPQTTFRLWRYREADADQKVIYESSQMFRFLGIRQDEDTALFVQLTDPTHSRTTPALIDLYTLSISTGLKSKVNSLVDAYFHNIHLSRDGRTIAFTSRQDNTTALWTVPVDGGKPRRILVENDPKIMISSLAWAPDGRSIVFGKQTRTNLLSMLAK